MFYKVTTQPTFEPVTVKEAKKHCRVLDNSEDSLIEDLIVAAREYAELITGSKLAEQTITAVCDKFPIINKLRLPVGPVVSVTSLIYTDTEGTNAAFADFTLDSFSNPAKIVLNPGASWPSVDLHPVNPIKIVYQAGNTDANGIPKKIKQAILLLVGHWYEHREEVITGVESYSVPVAAESLLQSIRHTEC